MATVASPITPLELLLKYDRPVPRYTSYPTAAAFDARVGPAQMAAQLQRAAAAPLSLYVHVPFCTSVATGSPPSSARRWWPPICRPSPRSWIW